jgi:hypothetical protein
LIDVSKFPDDVEVPSFCEVRRARPPHRRAP